MILPSAVFFQYIYAIEGLPLSDVNGEHLWPI